MGDGLSRCLGKTGAGSKGPKAELHERRSTWIAAPTEVLNLAYRPAVRLT